MKDTFKYKKIKTKKTAYKKVKEILTPKYLSQFKIKNKLSYDEKNLIINAKGKGFELNFEFSDSEVDVELKLALIYRAFSKKVNGILKKELLKVL